MGVLGESELTESGERQRTASRCDEGRGCESANSAASSPKLPDVVHEIGGGRLSRRLMLVTTAGDAGARGESGDGRVGV